MDLQTFKQDALVTESRVEALPMNPEAFAISLELAAHTARLLDIVKRAVYYGKKIDREDFESRLLALAYLVNALGEFNEEADINDATVDNGGVAPVDKAGADVEAAPEDIFVPLTPTSFNLRLAHAFIGAFTESGELIEELLSAVADGRPIDAVNISEEYGDLDWYKALAFDELELSEPASRSAVIAKLKVRYGDKFSKHAALNRDLNTERETLNEKAI